MPHEVQKPEDWINQKSVKKTLDLHLNKRDVGKEQDFLLIVKGFRKPTQNWMPACEIGLLLSNISTQQIKQSRKSNLERKKIILKLS